MKRTLPEVKVQGPDVTTERENVTLAYSPHPGNQLSHCCHSSRLVSREDAEALVSGLVSGACVLNKNTFNFR